MPGEVIPPFRLDFAVLIHVAVIRIALRPGGQRQLRNAVEALAVTPGQGPSTRDLHREMAEPDVEDGRPEVVEPGERG
jgi:hypothetical protein